MASEKRKEKAWTTLANQRVRLAHKTMLCVIPGAVAMREASLGGKPQRQPALAVWSHRWVQKENQLDAARWVRGLDPTGRS